MELTGHSGTSWPIWTRLHQTFTDIGFSRVKRELGQGFLSYLALKGYPER